jgi:hypothetical protein
MEQTQSSGKTFPTAFAENGRIRHFRQRSVHEIKEEKALNLFLLVDNYI